MCVGAAVCVCVPCSVMTCWPTEAGAVRNMIEHFGTGAFATVMDSYDYTAALNQVLPGALRMKPCVQSGCGRGEALQLNSAALVSRVARACAIAHPSKGCNMSRQPSSARGQKVWTMRLQQVLLLLLWVSCAECAEAKQAAGGYWVLRPDSGDPVEVVLMVRPRAATTAHCTMRTLACLGGCCGVRKHKQHSYLLACYTPYCAQQCACLRLRCCPHPLLLCPQALRALDKVFDSTTNSKGFRVIKGAGVIQGDGINVVTIANILTAVVGEGFSAENVAFGMGGGLLQRVNRCGDVACGGRSCCSTLPPCMCACMSAGCCAAGCRGIWGAQWRQHCLLNDKPATTALPGGWVLHC